MIGQSWVPSQSHSLREGGGQPLKWNEKGFPEENQGCCSQRDKILANAPSLIHSDAEAEGTGSGLGCPSFTRAQAAPARGLSCGIRTILGQRSLTHPPTALWPNLPHSLEFLLSRPLYIFHLGGDLPPCLCIVCTCLYVIVRVPIMLL